MKIIFNFVNNKYTLVEGKTETVFHEFKTRESLIRYAVEIVKGGKYEVEYVGMTFDEKKPKKFTKAEVKLVNECDIRIKRIIKGVIK